jgi:glycolate oxidase iron-sulfur subunit
MNLHAELDRCVMCGMCSQHCPTYTLTADENESPRGRIALISAFNSGQLGISDKLVAHLEHCTGCRACEDYCPSGVRFGAIMDAARAKISKQRPLPRAQHQMQNLLAKPQQTQRLGRWLGRYQRWGLQRLMRATGLLSITGLSKSDALIPMIPRASKQPEYSPAIDQAGIKKRGDVALFTGCISSIFDREALEASRYLLNRLGYGVYTPVAQTCCGAVHQHNGYPDKAAELAQTNLRIFNELDNKLKIEAIVHTSTGCTSFLQEYKQLDSNGSFTSKVQDINQFLLNANWPSNLTFQSLPIRVAIHEPCSARNVMHIANNPYQLLEAIPEMECVPLPDNALCCGAGGSQLLSPSTLSLRLRQKKLDTLSNSNIDALVSTNIGCALHLAAGLREQNQNVEVLHPVTLLARQLKSSKKYNETQTCTSSQASAKVNA